ncbi:flagellar basal body P-ring protein FlgI [Candidatus Poribacteria bacterium]|nr:flagellar basal body P-ring protein FlgI [Candidatus Poribacteria bacterium]
MKQTICVILSFCLFVWSDFEANSVSVRIKDVTTIPEMSSNQLWGMGIVVGLPGTGDSTRLALARQAVSNMLTRMEGLRISPDGLQARNIAAVSVTAELPPFSKAGDQIDVMVSSVGDAKTLSGGTLLFARLQAADGRVYATAQGVIASVAAPGEREAPIGSVAKGGLVVNKIDTSFDDLEVLSLRLNHPDFSTASLVTKKINETLWDGIAEPRDPSTIQVRIPDAYKKKLVSFVSMLGELTVEPDTVATVVVNEKTGAVVIGEGVRISTFAVSLNGTGASSLTIKINRLPGGESTLDDVVAALKAAGTSTMELIEVLKLMEKAGALHAKLIIM